MEVLLDIEQCINGWSLITDWSLQEKSFVKFWRPLTQKELNWDQDTDCDEGCVGQKVLTICGILTDMTNWEPLHPVCGPDEGVWYRHSWGPVVHSVQAWLSTKVRQHHQIFPWWHDGSRSGKRLCVWPLPSVQRREARMRLGTNPVQPYVCHHAVALSKTDAGITIRYRCDGRFFDLRRLKEGAWGPCARLPVCRWLCSCSTQWTRPAGTVQLPGHCSQSIRPDNQPAENRSDASACTWPFSPRAQHRNRGHNAEQRWLLHLPGELLDLKLQHGQRSLKQTSESRCFLWQAVEQSVGRTRHHATHQAGSLQSSCHHLSALRLWNLDAVQKTTENPGPVPSPLPAQYHGHLLGGQGLQHRSAPQSGNAWHRGTHHESTAEMGRACGTDGRLASTKDGLLLWAGFWHTEHRTTTQALQGLPENIPWSLRYPTSGLGNSRHWPQCLATGCLQGSQSLRRQEPAGPGPEARSLQREETWLTNCCSMSRVWTALCVQLWLALSHEDSLTSSSLATDFHDDYMVLLMATVEGSCG